MDSQKPTKISVALATFNEEGNIRDCLECVKNLASEIVVVDGSSTDNTVQIAKEYTEKVIVTGNPPIFHLNKQKAIDECSNEWILQLDADERVTTQLSQEILKVTLMDGESLEHYQTSLPERDLFAKHKALLEERDGKIGDDSGDFNAFFIPRINFFLGKFLRHGGVYPDGVIRLIRKGKAHLPGKSVHEQMVVDGRVGWLQNSLKHIDSPTFKRYLEKNNRYIDLIVREYRDENLTKNLTNSFNFLVIKPLWWFLLTQIRHKGFLDGFQGIVFSFFSALRFPRAYLRYLKG